MPITSLWTRRSWTRKSLRSRSRPGANSLSRSLGLTHLIGSPQLKPYMHGFFLSLQLYTKARLIANPTSYTEHRERLLATKLAEESESRIRAKKQQPKVNKALAERIRRNEEREEAKEKKKRERLAKGKPVAKNILLDPRFQELWQNPDFEVDEESREFELLNPATAHNAVSVYSRMCRKGADGASISRSVKRLQSRKKPKRVIDLRLSECPRASLRAKRKRVQTVTMKEVRGRTCRIRAA
jgi:hypothetical protein